jgi:nitrate reductase gamma subunit
MTSSPVAANTFAFLVGGVLPYFALAVFAAGALHRLFTWRRAPQPGLMTLYPTGGSGWKSLVKEAMFFPSLFRGDRTLWLFAWLFHAALALAFLGHLRVVTGMIDRGLAIFGIDAGGMGLLSAIAGSFAGAILATTVLLLLGRRVFVARVRESSAAPDFLALVLLVAVITTGNLMRLGEGHIDLVATRAWAASLYLFSPIIALPPALLPHVFFAELLVLYLAFSKLMHFGGFFFTFSLIKRSQP